MNSNRPIEQAKTQNEDLKPYTMEEINTMLEESERDFKGGRCYSTKQVIQMCREAQSAFWDTRKEPKAQARKTISNQANAGELL
jgi:hypothetical protein